MINQGYYKNHVGLGRRRLSLTELYRQIIDESLNFSNVKNKYKLRPNHEGWDFDAKINDEYIIIYVYVEETRFSRFTLSPKVKSEINLDGKVFNFGFEIGEDRDSNQYNKTTYRDYFKILATVGDALNNVIQNEHPSIITFFSNSKHGGAPADIQKDDIYFNALERNKPNNYELTQTTDTVDNKKGLLLYRKF